MHERWEDEAEAWARWARTPGHDAWHWRLNWPAFLELLPPAGRLTLDLGCGEGRGGVLARGGLEMAFHGVHHLLQDYVGALLAAGLTLDALREPAPTDEHVAAFPALAKARRRPPFLHFSAVRR